MSTLAELAQPDDRRRVYLVRWKRHGGDTWRSKLYLTEGRAVEFANWIADETGFPVVLDELNVITATRYLKPPFTRRHS